MKVLCALLLVFIHLFFLCLADDGSQLQNSSDIIDLDKLLDKRGDEWLNIMKFLVNSEYSTNKLQIISDMVDRLRAEWETRNVTLIAYQNIYYDNGAIKEIRTIELALPNLEDNSVCCSGKDGRRSLDFKESGPRKYVGDLIEKSGYMTHEMELHYDNMGGKVYIGRGLTTDTYSLFFVNKTLYVETLEEVEEDCRKLNRSGPVSVSYLMYDKEGKFIESVSNVVPEYFVQVASDYKEPEAKIVEITLQSVANAFLQSGNKSDVPERIRQMLEEHYPELIFTVTSNEPAGAYLNIDFSIHMYFRSFHFPDAFLYSVYGYKPPTRI